MTLEQLEFISEVERTGTIVSAAKNLNVSHTTISRAISNLEDELGFVIFLRSRRGSTLTPKGQETIHLARNILADADQIKQLGRTTPKNELRIGSYPIVISGFLQDVVAQFKQLHPDTTIFINHLTVDEITTQVKSHALDFGLMFYLPSLLGDVSSDVDITELLESRLVLACSPKSRLAHKKYVTPSDMRKETFILQSEDQVLYMMKHIFFPEAMPNVTMFTNNNDLIKSTIIANNAVATYTEMFLIDDPLVRSGQLTYVPIQMGDELYKLKYIYVRPSKKSSSRAEREFIKLLKRTATAWLNNGSKP